MISGELIQHAAVLGVSEVLLFRIGFAAVPTAMLLGLPFLKTIREPDFAESITVFGAMRTIRQATVFAGATQFLNSVLVRSFRNRSDSDER